eukprot:7713229-Karenia_brevis.AAC.1
MHERNCKRKTKGVRCYESKGVETWMDFGAGVKIQGDILRELLDDGNKMIPTQWIGTDQNHHFKRPGKEHVA